MPFVIVGINLASTRKEFCHFVQESGRICYKTSWDWYDTDAILDVCAQQSTEAVIPAKRNRKCARKHDEYLYRHRHLVENAFLWLKRWRGIATRYAKNTASFLAAVQIRCLAIWIQIL